MDILSSEFLSALFAIIIIDLVLAGDNAIVIALAARNVPKHLQRRTIMWGTVGAIVVRTSLTLIVVWLLKIPGLLFAGGLLLVWIAYKLLIPEEPGEEESKVAAASSFWGAIRTVVVADTIMGLDNVLAVAGAAHGNFALVVIGLLISIPIVIWGSTLLLRFVEKYPAFVYFGSGVLAWTSVKMMTSEPLLKGWLANHPAVVALLYLVVIGGVLGAGFVRNHRSVETRIGARVAQFPRPEGAAATEQGAAAPLRVLVPVDDSPNARHAVDHVVGEHRKQPGFEVHLLNVQTPFSRHVSQFAARTDRDAQHREQAEATLAPLRSMLQSANIPYVEHMVVGPRAETIAAEAKRLNADHIVIATARKNSLTRMLEASVTNRVLDLTSVPVEVVVGGSVSKLERWGVPAVLVVVLALLAYLALD
jgi:YjbE family integral membrane protein